MARTRTLANLVADVRQRTNMEESEFVTDDEITEYLNQELAELHGRLTMGEGHPHFLSTTTISVTVGTTLYALPADFWKVVRMVATVDSITRDMEPFMEGERASLLNTQYFTATFCGGPRYRVQGDNVEILPVNRALSVELRYIQTCPRLVEDSDTVDGFNGYEVAALHGACAMVKEKEQTNPSFFIGLKERVYQLIDAMAAQRDASHPERVTDVVGWADFDREWLP
jgi:hypothetical protein